MGAVPETIVSCPVTRRSFHLAATLPSVAESPTKYENLGFGLYLAIVREVARRRHRATRQERDSQERVPRGDLLRCRATRLLRSGRPRKASVALRELVALTEAPAHYVALGHSLIGAQRTEDGLRALRQGMWLHSRQGSPSRARSVARMILKQTPHDSVARKYA
jgi:hypothetical protein